MKRLLLLTLLLTPALLPAQTITPEAKSRAAELVKRMTLEEKLDYIGGYNDFYIRAVPRLGIPEIRMADGPQGVRNDTRSTMYASGIAAAATWSPETVYNMGVGLGRDARARGVHILLGPGVNIYRSPLCGRNFEYFGEDPCLTGEIAVQYIRGVQSQGVMATVKHFAGNNQEWNRHHASSDIDERTLQEIYFPAFRRAVQDAGVGSVMSSYNPLNGVHTSENHDLAVRTLRDAWGFEGIFMSDWNATYSGVGAANGGLDLEMPSGKFMNRGNLLKAIETGLVREETIDLKVQHILQTLIAFGFFDRDQRDDSIPEQDAVSREAALQLAREGIVLLKNDNDLLPLHGGRIAVMGPNAARVVTGGGSGYVHPCSTVPVLDGMQSLGRRWKIVDLSDKRHSDLTAGGFYTGFDCREPGLRAAYFPNRKFQGTPVLEHTETAIEYDWGKGSPAEGMPEDNFSIRWTGVLKPAANTTLRFTIGGDDGYRIFIGGECVAGDWGNHRLTTRSAELNLEAGRTYPVAIEYFDTASSASVHFKYEFTDLEARDEALRTADAVVLCVGFSPETEKENSDRTFSLPEGQDELIEHIASLNDRVILVVNSGGGIDMSKWHDKVAAILMAWYPGQEGGRAVAEILSGRISPGGRLPITIEKRWEDNPVHDNYYNNVFNDYRKETYLRIAYNEGIFVGYRGYDRTQTEPLYPFGYGLSYTTFDYSNLTVTRDGDAHIVSFDLTNSGKSDAAEVAQLYVTDPECTVPRPAKELKGFRKVFLRKGETKHVTLRLNDDAFAFYDTLQGKFTVEPGEFIISVGPSSADLRLRARIIYE